MSGIYIHIPFCRQACHYCDFHFSTNLSRQDQMVSAIVKEISERDEIKTEPIETVYFGGGTPSLLGGSQVERILSSLNLARVEVQELTFEANPEDLDQTYLKELLQLGINRLSIGFQSTSDEALQWMNRAHSAEDAHNSVKLARETGFTNISLDLIYAVPHGQTRLDDDLNMIAELEPEHVSIYGLTIEERTVFGKQRRDGVLRELSEDAAAEQYLKIVTVLKNLGYEQYEVSNFARPGFRSRHNSSYWSGKKYTGIGPGAHSFDGLSRRFNVRNNAKYMAAVANGDPYFEREDLTQVQRMNEQILTQLRTVEGIDLKLFYDRNGVDLAKENEPIIEELAQRGLAVMRGKHISLTTNGFLIADEVALRIFFDE